MNKFTHLADFLGYLFDDEQTVKKAQAITAGILQARSSRLSDIAREMAGNEAANYKRIQRFVAQTALKANLLRLYQEEAPFLIGDPTEMPRPEAQKTDYVLISYFPPCLKLAKQPLIKSGLLHPNSLATL
jgi:hypothetical protein